MASPITFDEKSLLLDLQQGNSRAFEQLYHHYKRPIYYNILKLVHLPEVAEELTQDVFMKVWEQHSKITPERSFPAFLHRIAANLTIDFYRRAAQHKKLEEHLIHFATELYDPISSTMDATENKEALYKALNKLSTKRKKVFILCKLEGKTYTEAAEQLGISTGTVNDHVVKASKFLREELLRQNLEIYLLIILFVFSF
ncbi:RNA polymerase sigma-70 factor, ECF subfamily [bacterium A37T11]|nr:RNA polymerase sigma-70 factor, ECF subfamily [bacterium A37T11]